MVCLEQVSNAPEVYKGWLLCCVCVHGESSLRVQDIAVEASANICVSSLWQALSGQTLAQLVALSLGVAESAN